MFIGLDTCWFMVLMQLRCCPLAHCYPMFDTQYKHVTRNKLEGITVSDDAIQPVSAYYCRTLHIPGNCPPGCHEAASSSGALNLEEA